MNKSETIGKLAAALAKAQSQMEPAKKDTTGGFGKFADLGEVIDTIRKVSASNGLSFSQFPVGDAAGVGVSTILMHESGEWLSDTIYLAVGAPNGRQNPAQVAGGNITYLRRYALASVFGVYADEDTDGGASRSQSTQPTRQAQPAQPAQHSDNNERKPIVSPPPDFTGIPTNGNSKHTQEDFVALVRTSKFKNAGDIVKQHTTNGGTNWGAAYAELESHVKALA